MLLPREVQLTVSAFLDAMDDVAPGLVEGLYLHGSLGFGEFSADRSDIDFVAVLAARPDADTVDALADAHRRLRARHPRPFFDGMHVLLDDLAKPPDQCPDVPCTQMGVFKEAGRFDVNPVTWHELARHGVVVRGPVLTEADVWTDDDALRAFSHANLTSYWDGVVAALEQEPQSASEPEAVEWCVLGVSRLHHLLATGTLTSKSGAGRYALTAFEPRWHPIITEALRIRESASPDRPPSSCSYGASYSSCSSYDDPRLRGSDTIGFTAMAVQAGLELGCSPRH